MRGLLGGEGLVLLRGVTARRISIALLAAFFVLAGANHFRNPEIYLPMMPDWLPWHRGLIAASGAAEILGGLGILWPKWRRLAGWWLIAVLVAVFPANIEMLRDNQLGLPEWALWARLPIQGLLVLWVWWRCIRSGRNRRPDSKTAGRA